MNRTDALLFIAVIVVALALGATIFFIYQAREERVVRSSKEVIEQIDTQLERGYMKQAADNIERLSESDVSAATYLMLIKRSDVLRKQTGSWELYRHVAKTGHESYSGRNDLYALYVYALLRSGMEDKAVQLTGDRAVEGERWQSLREEIHLYVGDAAIEGDRTGTGREELYAILESDSPEPFFRLYRNTNNRGFLLNALLLYAGDGRIPRAWELLQREPTLMQEHPELTFFLAIDTGKPETAQEVLGDNPGLFDPKERLLLRADLALRMGEYKRAEELCFRLIRDYPQSSWLPYHNAAYLRLERGERVDQSLLQPDADFGTGNREFLLNIAQLLIAFGRTEEAQRVLRQGTDIDKESTEYKLIMEKAGDTVNPERYKSLLRMLVNREGGEQYATHLAWFYLGIEDYRSLTELLDYYESRYGYAAWLHFYRGVLAYEQHRYAEAGDHFEKSLQGRRFWRSYYNAALARARAGSVQEALNLLDKARIQCGGKRECDAVHFAQADIHLQHGNYQKAQEQLARGFELDPHDIDGRLLQEVLKERID